MTGPGASRRYPWARGGLYGVIAALSPFAWVLEVDGCAPVAPTQEELSGVALLAKVDPEGWAIVAPVLAVALLAPWLATKLTAGWAALLQGLGLAATGFVAYVAWFVLFFALFSDRLLRAAGWAVAATVVLTLLEALARTVLALREWWAGRRAGAGIGT